MSVTLEATVGGTSANSYILNADADGFLDARQPNDAWTADTVFETDQDRALAAACVILDRQRWKGYRATTTQALAWPRTCVPDPDPVYGGDTYLSETTIPAAIRAAQAELAYLLLAGDYDPGPSGLDGIAAVKVGSIEVTASPSPIPPGLPESVRRAIAPYLQSTEGSVRLVRG